MGGQRPGSVMTAVEALREEARVLLGVDGCSLLQQLLERALHITEILALSGVRSGQADNILLWQQGVAIDVITADFEFQLVASSRRCGIRDLRNQNGRKLALLFRRI